MSVFHRYEKPSLMKIRNLYELWQEDAAPTGSPPSFSTNTLRANTNDKKETTTGGGAGPSHMKSSLLPRAPSYRHSCVVKVVQQCRED